MAQIPQLAGEFGKAVVVADERVIAAGGLEAAIAAIKPLRVCKYSGREPSVNSVGAIAKECEGADVLVAIGGGSTIDIAKAAAIVLRGGTQLERFEGAEKVDCDPVPIIGVPTTAGTGSEVTGSCVLETASGSHKMSVRSSKIVPKIAILDPNLLATTPAPTIAAAGVDAFGHALEAYFSTRASAITDGLALAAIRLINSNLVTYYRTPSNTAAAAAVAWGASMAGIALTSARVGVAHAIAAAIGPAVKLPHGVCVSLGLPFAARYNAPMLDRIRLADLLVALGADSTKGAAQVETLVRRLIADVKLPATTTAAGKALEVDPPLIHSVLTGGRMETNPAPMDEGTIREVLVELIG